MKKATALVVVAGLLAGCQSDGSITKQDLGMLTGAAGGAIVGHNIGKGKGNIAAIAAGTLIGAMVGSEIGKSLDNADIAAHNRAQMQALEKNRIGSASTWHNPDTGASGTIVPEKTYQVGQTYCREYSDTIKIGGKTERAYGRACRQPDGSWKIVE
ncbi:MAG: glycine zipper 2TM domain-containing protein [Proteobacteria bacterium]|nr:glycine zipper 2TM domain-containing protein [Pseudomonadota bacterium]